MDITYFHSKSKPMSNLTPRELLTGDVRLASLPEVFTRVNNLIDDPKSSAADIGHLISEDPSLTIRLLKIVNSAFYGFPSKIDTVSRAITIVGTSELRDLILATSVIKVFNSIPEDLLNMNDFWKHSVACALIAHILASKRHDEDLEPLFVSGLLHDVGKLVIYMRIPELGRETLARKKFNHVDLCTAERDVLGFDHAELGGELASLWKLPDLLQQTLRFHHSPQKAESHQAEVAIINLADQIAKVVALGKGGVINGEMPKDEALWAATGLSSNVLESTLQEAELQFEETIKLILYDNAA
ncbi:MAG: HDOD domain-containing protein [Gammaproteobacteria bacterium]|nr:HDOD domain-containing protein [Gammaproteobacteria bacterium]